MKFKGFFKLSWIKVILTVVLFLIIEFVPIIKVQPMCFMAPCGPLYYTISFFLYYAFIGTFDYIGNLIWPVYEFKIGEGLFVISLILISYIISCLIIYIYNEMKRGKKKK